MLDWGTGLRVGGYHSKVNMQSAQLGARGTACRRIWLRRAAAYADSARIALEQQLTASPEDAQRNVLLGLALAYPGRKAEATEA